MTYHDFNEKHLYFDSLTNKATLKDIVIKYVKVGKEAIELVSLFDLTANSLMIPDGSRLSGFHHTDKYINFINVDGKSFIQSADESTNNLDVSEFYYDHTIREYCREIINKYHGYDCDLQDKEDINTMYKILGMEVIEDERK